MSTPPERFGNMMLHADVLAAFEHRYEAVEAQHEADMAYEIACPVCIGGAYSWIEKGELHFCLTCQGTGRVTLGALVAADRARKG